MTLLYCFLNKLKHPAVKAATALLIAGSIFMAVGIAVTSYTFFDGKDKRKAILKKLGFVLFFMAGKKTSSSIFSNA